MPKHNLNAAQIREELNCGKSAVDTLFRAGLLPDQKQTRDGGKRHYREASARDVSRVKSVWKGDGVLTRARAERFKHELDLKYGGNGNGHASPGQPTLPIPPPASPKEQTELPLLDRALTPGPWAVQLMKQNEMLESHLRHLRGRVDALCRVWGV